MGKILYPIGTRVALRACKNPTVPLYVVDYIKGDKYPYKVSMVKGGDVLERVKAGPGKYLSKLSHKGLIKWENHPFNLDTATEDTGVKAEQNHQVAHSAPMPAAEVYTKAEVDKMLRQLVDDHTSEMSQIRQDLVGFAEAAQCSLDHEISKLHDHMEVDAEDIANNIAHQVFDNHTLSEDE